MFSFRWELSLFIPPLSLSTFQFLAFKFFPLTYSSPSSVNPQTSSIFLVFLRKSLFFSIFPSIFFTVTIKCFTATWFWTTVTVSRINVTPLWMTARWQCFSGSWHCVSVTPPWINVSVRRINLIPLWMAASKEWFSAATRWINVTSLWTDANRECFFVTFLLRTATLLWIDISFQCIEGRRAWFMVTEDYSRVPFKIMLNIIEYRILNKESWI